MIFGGLICKLFDHKWRRLTVKEFLIPRSTGYVPRNSLRICRRCGAERIVKARKTKTKETT